MQPSRSQQKWDKRYQAKAKAPQASAPVFLAQNIATLKPGRVLDVACGDGAASLFLAEQGFAVQGIDISPIGLQRLQQQAQAQGLNIETSVVDLEDEQIDLSALGQFDAIVLSRYKPSANLLKNLATLLLPQGTLLLTTFNMAHHQRTGFSAGFCLHPREFAEVSDKLQLLSYVEDIDAAGMDGYLFTKKS